MAALAAIDPADDSQLGDRARKNRQTTERAPRMWFSTRRQACTARRSTPSSNRSTGSSFRCSPRCSTFSRPAISSRRCWPRKRCATNRRSLPWSACASIRVPAAAELERFLAKVRPAGPHPSAQYATLRADNDARDDHVRPVGIACGEGSGAMAGDHRLGEQLAVGRIVLDRSGASGRASAVRQQRNDRAPQLRSSRWSFRLGVKWRDA
jgi:hypothetical protein